MKIVGLLCVLFGSVLLGLRYGWELELKHEERKELLSLLSLIKSEVRFGKSSLPECFCKVGKELDNPYGTALLEVYEEAKEQGGIPLYDLLKKHFYEGEDTSLFLRCFQNPSVELESILSALERGEEELRNRNRDLEKELVNRKKLGLSLGTMGGLVVVLLFL